MAGAIALTAGIALPERAAMGQSEPAAELAQSTATYDIPAQDLNAALLTFARRAGLQIFYDVDRVRGLRSAPLVGTFAPQQGLAQLLAGTGISYRFTGANTVSLDRAGSASASGAMQLDPVQVQGSFPVPPQAMIDNLPPPYAGGQVAIGGQLGLLGNRGVMDTPFNQTNYTAKKAQDQQAKTIRDVLIDDPSVRSLIPDSNQGANTVQIRGFALVPGNYTYGGLYGIIPSSSPMAEMAERIEVLKGPSAMLNGMPPVGNIGGTINIVPKRAPEEDLTQATASFTATGQPGGHVDFARRFGSDKQFGVRLNGVFKGGQGAVEGSADLRGLALLGLDFRGERVRLSADLGYQYQQIDGTIPYISLGAGVPLPWAPDARKSRGQPWSFVNRKDLFGVVRAEVDLTERITAYATVGSHDFRYGGIDSPLLTVNNFYGGATSALGGLTSSDYRTFLAGEAGIRALVDTGLISHEIAMVGTTYTSASGFATVSSPGFATNLYNPTIVVRPNLATPVANKTATQGLSSLGFADTLSAADKRIQLTVGARLQRVQATNFNVTTGAVTSGYDQSALSPSVALLFKPLQNVSVYGNWIQGLQQGTIVGANFTNTGEVFPPYKPTQYEVGVKVDWGGFTTTVSAFQISQPSTISVPGPMLPTLVLNGEQRNQGLEINLFGEPAQGVRLLGGVMLLNAVLARTQGRTNDGWIAPFSPGFNLNLSGEWDLPFLEGLTLSGRAIYTGSQYVDTTWPRRSLPEWTRFDIGARYAFDNPSSKGKRLVARFDVENILDNSYWAGGASVSNLMVGAPRTFRLSLTADF